MELADQNVVMQPSLSALDNKQRKRGVLQYNCKHNTSLCIFLLTVSTFLFWHITYCSHSQHAQARRHTYYHTNM